MNPLFNKIESYKHNLAIKVLIDWINKNPQLLGYNYALTTIPEESFYLNGLIYFIPDITVYDNDQIIYMIEVKHTNGIDAKKIHKLQYFKYIKYQYFKILEIDAEWIMRQIGLPYKLKSIEII